MCKFPFITIFMPVYNGENYIRKTIESIINQTFKNFELICVDDSSTDSSYKIIEEYASVDQRIRLLKKKNGGCVSKSWVFVLPYVRGEYLCYTSQDDLFSENLLQLEYEKFIETGADAILPDVVSYYEHGKNDCGYFGLNGNRDLILTGRQACVYSLDWTIHGFALFKVDIIRRVGIDDFSLNSDELTTRKLFFNCSKVAFCRGVFYYRQDNIDAITKRASLRRFEYFDTISKIKEFMLQNEFTEIELAKIKLYEFTEIITVRLYLIRNKYRLSKSDYEIGKQMVKSRYCCFDKSDLVFVRYDYLKRFFLCSNYFLFSISCSLYSLICRK